MFEELSTFASFIISGLRTYFIKFQRRLHGVAVIVSTSESSVQVIIAHENYCL